MNSINNLLYEKLGLDVTDRWDDEWDAWSTAAYMYFISIRPNQNVLQTVQTGLWEL